MDSELHEFKPLDLAIVLLVLRNEVFPGKLSNVQDHRTTALAMKAINKKVQYDRSAMLHVRLHEYNSLKRRAWHTQVVIPPINDEEMPMFLIAHNFTQQSTLYCL